ncbi:c-type heme family protein [Gimesia sp.]|uniref:c-type heme family protein n=1 Tax=Gimesia sp. TaxID=2024833 RepID=UPI003A8CCA6E
MNKNKLLLCVCLGLLGFYQAQCGLSLNLLQAEPRKEKKKPVHKYLPATVDEARIRARILHETIHGSLQVMHRDLFREDESIAIPSHSLEDVFKELERGHGIKIRWLAVNAKAMNIDNEAKTDFEKEAVRILSDGKPEYDQLKGNRFSYAGAIRLPSQCLKCHLPQRTSNKPRMAGLVISMSLKPKS